VAESSRAQDATMEQIQTRLTRIEERLRMYR
jgi:hypothetical protein